MFLFLLENISTGLGGQWTMQENRQNTVPRKTKQKVNWTTDYTQVYCGPSNWKCIDKSSPPATICIHSFWTPSSLPGLIQLYNNLKLKRATFRRENGKVTFLSCADVVNTCCAFLIVCGMQLDILAKVEYDTFRRFQTVLHFLNVENNIISKKKKSGMLWNLVRLDIWNTLK